MSVTLPKSISSLLLQYAKVARFPPTAVSGDGQSYLWPLKVMTSITNDHSPSWSVLAAFSVKGLSETIFIHAMHHSTLGFWCYILTVSLYYLILYRCICFISNNINYIFIQNLCPCCIWFTNLSQIREEFVNRIHDMNIHYVYIWHPLTIGLHKVVVLPTVIMTLLVL